VYRRKPPLLCLNESENSVPSERAPLNYVYKI